MILNELKWGGRLWQNGGSGPSGGSRLHCVAAAAAGGYGGGNYYINIPNSLGGIFPPCCAYNCCRKALARAFVSSLNVKRPSTIIDDRLVLELELLAGGSKFAGWDERRRLERLMLKEWDRRGGGGLSSA